MLQVVDNAVDNNVKYTFYVLLYFENDPLSPSFETFSIVVTCHTKYGVLRNIQRKRESNKHGKL